MKVTIITKADGTIVGVTPVHTSIQPGALSGGLIAGHGETAHEIDLPHEFNAIVDGEKLHHQIKAHLAKKP